MTINEYFAGPSLYKDKGIPQTEEEKEFALVTDINCIYRVKIMEIVCQIEGDELKFLYEMIYKHFQGIKEKTEKKTVSDYLG